MNKYRSILILLLIVAGCGTDPTQEVKESEVVQDSIDQSVVEDPAIIIIYPSSIEVDSMIKEIREEYFDKSHQEKKIPTRT